MKNALAIIAIILCLALIVGGVFVSCTPVGIAMCNTYEHSLQEADDATNYETKKEVEDTCRSMIASYNADRLTYEQYKDSEDGEKQSWAEQAKMRANKTASTYNNYILKNSYVWEDNIPSDIEATLAYLD